MASQLSPEVFEHIREIIGYLQTNCNEDRELLPEPPNNDKERTINYNEDVKYYLNEAPLSESERIGLQQLKTLLDALEELLPKTPPTQTTDELIEEYERSLNIKTRAPADPDWDLRSEEHKEQFAAFLGKDTNEHYTKAEAKFYWEGRKKSFELYQEYGSDYD